MSLLLCALAQEPWADERLKVRDGLELWLDAARPGEGRPEGVWRDASGRGRHAGGKALFGTQGVRFDGRGQQLSVEAPGCVFRDLTIFIVAAPFRNAGGFRALLALNAAGQNDFTSGLTLDQGPGGGERFDALNLEGAGFQGARSLMKDPLDFGVLARICVVSTTDRMTLFVDEKLQGARERKGPPFRMDQLSVGARRYALGGPPQLAGFFEGEIAEILLYGRALANEERKAVDAYLAAKHGEGRRVALPPLPPGAKRLVRVPNPPPVQVLAPGYEVRALEVELPNVNNVLYRPDGALVALGYNGDIHLLRDTDGDGLEDKAELYWDNKGRLRAPVGLALDPRDGGLYVASKGKCSKILDGLETVIASGWAEIPHGVDALGVAFDPRDGSVYFGLGCTNFTNAYLLKDGVAGYRLEGERGTVLRVAPDFKSREIFATGIRFPVGLRFSPDGDLFATDQEGATWLPNGNPLDELLHVQKGRHYGFPPRHPRHLPGVIDEPSVFDYAPQHQSTCGLAFAPDGELYVTGYSRGKLYRTSLLKTPAGYVARNRLIAAMTMLPADVCVSPRGDLVVAAHGGGPDWGSGPDGKGRLYRIRRVDPETPQAVAAWAHGPQEVRVAFDRPLEPAQAKQPSIEWGRYVDAGDRFESVRPGYQVVQDQLAAPRFDLPVLAVQMTADRRTLILATAPQPEAAGYALSLPGLDLRYDLHGVEARWEGVEGSWSGWLPHLDLAVARALTKGSAMHDALWSLCGKPGRLTLRTKLDLRNVLRPEVQPGARLDHAPAEETVTLEVEGAVRKDAETFELATPGTLRVSMHTAEDPRPRALPLRRFLLPWAVLQRERAPAARAIPELAGGRWREGRELFFGDQAACGKCHRFDGRGAEIGPDLSNLPQRDYASVLRDVTEPNFAIHPDYIPQVVALADGRVLSGVVRTDGDDLLLADTAGVLTKFRRSQVEKMKPAALSIMPEGLAKALGPEKLRDLLTFLLQEGPRMPDYGRETPPAPRAPEELKALLAGSNPAAGRPIHVALVAGRKDHGPGEHDYPAWKTAWTALLSRSEAKVTSSTEWPTPDELRTADVVVFYQQGAWTPERAKDVDALLARGAGLVYLHYAVDGGKDPAGLAKRIGLAWQGGRSKFRHGTLDLVFDGKHPISRNFGTLRLHDESYWNLVGDPKDVELLAAGLEDGKLQPLVWTREVGGGRVFVSIPGHFAWTFDDPLFRVLLLRGMAWAAKEPVDRFNDLAAPGAR